MEISGYTTSLSDLKHGNEGKDGSQISQESPHGFKLNVGNIIKGINIWAVFIQVLCSIHRLESSGIDTAKSKNYKVYDSAQCTSLDK